MKKEYRMIVLMGFAALSFIGVLQAEDRDRIETVRGSFICVTEVKAGDHVYTGIDVKPFDRDNHVLVLIPENRKDLLQIARKLEKGTQLDISFVTEEGKNFIRGIKAKLNREIREEGAEGEEKVIIRREVVRESSEDERPESRRSRGVRRDFEPERPRDRQERQDRGPATQLNQLQRQLREVVSEHLDRMSKSVREVMADHLWRMDAEFRELRARVDRIERELDQLRAENERLRRELRERPLQRREREEQIRERRENREREKREETRNDTP
ncbi:MAG: hypothetical protein JXM79_13115 [Sedimentisphaerales bacterium]|nr:hypothetical protein [Sedimentisphaerales bacterium]